MLCNRHCKSLYAWLSNRTGSRHGPHLSKSKQSSLRHSRHTMISPHLNKTCRRDSPDRLCYFPFSSQHHHQALATRA
jgi:hypothetical protein